MDTGVNQLILLPAVTGAEIIDMDYQAGTLYAAKGSVYIRTFFYIPIRK